MGFEGWGAEYGVCPFFLEKNLCLSPFSLEGRVRGYPGASASFMQAISPFPPHKVGRWIARQGETEGPPQAEGHAPSLTLGPIDPPLRVGPLPRKAGKMRGRDVPSPTGRGWP